MLPLIEDEAQAESLRSMALVLTNGRIEPSIGPKKKRRKWPNPVGANFLVIPPFRYASRSPRRAGCLHRLLKLRNVSLDERPQLAERLLKLLRGGCVVVLLCLSGSRSRHALIRNDRADPLEDRGWKNLLALTKRRIAPQRAKNLVVSFLYGRRVIR